MIRRSHGVPVVRLRGFVAVSVLCLSALTSLSGQVRSASQGAPPPG
jgi:hypothetical protein